MMFTKLHTRLRQRLRETKEALWQPGVTSLLFGAGVFLSVLLFWAFWTFSLWQNQRGIEEALVKLERKSRPLLGKKKSKEIFFKSFSGSDSGYLAQHLLKLSFLDKNVELLAQLQEEETQYAPLRERYNFLRSEGNRVALEKTSEKNSLSYKETEWRTAHPVEVSYEDLQRVFSLIEAPHPGRPQLFFKNFSLRAQEKGLFLLEFTLIQRDPHA